MTEHGVNSLILKLRELFSSEWPSSVELRDIRNWSEFDTPRPLDEDFDVPPDFQWFSEAQHAALLSDIGDVEGGVRVLTGKPGSGKSTYLSKLHEVLIDEGYVCLRHHYHISPSDDDPQARLLAARVVEALKAQLKEHSEALGDLAHVNSRDVSLSEFMAALAAWARSQGQAAVLLIDGLDHAARYDASSELKELLLGACHPQRGLWILLGMQEIAQDQLPQVVTDLAPEENWMVIRGLDDNAVERLVKENRAGLQLPEDATELRLFLRKIEEITKGNPLHLRYTLKEVAGVSSGRIATAHDLSHVIPYDREIENYYEVLWRQLSGVSRSMLMAISFVHEPLLEDEFLDFAGLLVDSVSDISEGFHSIRHLVDVKRYGVAFFHSSLELFVTEQAEWRQQIPELRRRLQKWLSTTDHPYLTWALLPIVNHQMGDDGLLLSIDRQWLTRSLENLWPIPTIRRQLDVALEVAFENRRYGKVIELGILVQYLENALQFQSDLVDRIWEVGLNLKRPKAATVDPSHLSRRQVVALAILARKQGDLNAVIGDVRARIEKLHRDGEFRRRGDWSSSPPEAAEKLIDVTTLDRKHAVKDVYDYIIQFRDLEWSGELFSHYASRLLWSGEVRKLLALLRLKLEPQERSAVLTVAAFHDLDNQSSSFAEMISKADASILSAPALVYRAIVGRLSGDELSLPSHKQFPKEISEFDLKTQPARTELYLSAFATAFCLARIGGGQIIDEWIESAPSHWSIQMAGAIVNAGSSLGRMSLQSVELDMKVLSRAVSAVRPLTWPDDRGSLEWQRPIHEVITGVIRILLALKVYLGQQALVDIDETLGQFPSSYLSEYYLLKFVVHEWKGSVTRMSFESFIKRERNTYVSVAEEFPVRADHYLDLAELALKQSNRDVALEMYQNALDNFLAYGSHKDYLIAHVIDAVEACAKLGSSHSISWATRLAPAVENVESFTDGDDVTDFPSRMGPLLAIVSPALLRRYYMAMATSEKLTLAQNLFADIIGCGTYDTQYEIALAETALDRGSLTALRRRAADKPGAASALANIEDYFGGIEFRKTDESSSGLRHESDDVDISGITPSHLAEQYSSLEFSLDRRKFLQRWAEYWLDNEPTAAPNALLSLLKGKELKFADSSLLDILFQLVHAREPDRAFDLLCWAQSNDGGWSRYWTGPELAERRWEIVREEYSHRYVEFFEQSVKRSGFRYGETASYFIPLPRAVEYFALFGDLAICEEITEAAVRQVELLMANLVLPAASWISVPDVGSLDLLVERLSWPSSYVRERVAVAVARLLPHSEYGLEVFSRLCRWLAEPNRLESETVLGLLPVIRACQDAGGPSNLDLTQLIKSISNNSPVIEQLVRELRTLTGQSLQAPERTVFAPPPPTNYVANSSFTEYVNSYLAPFYVHQAEILIRESCPSFMTYWAYTSEGMMRAANIKPSAREALDFQGGHMDQYLSGMSTKMSEVYRTAFLRTLQYFYSESFIDKERFLLLAYSTMPVELSNWEVKPSRLPLWWIHVERDSMGDNVEEGLLSIKLSKSPEELVSGADGRFILGLDGAIKFPEGWANATSSARISMVGFGYQILGPDLPEAKALAGELLYSPMITLQASSAARPLRILDSASGVVQYPSGRLKMGDMVCMPIIGRNRDLPISLWQAFREYGFFSLCREFRAGLTTRIADNEVCYEQSGEPVVLERDWLDGLAERHYRDLDIPHGMYILADKHFLLDSLARRNLRLGFVVRICYKFKRSLYEEAQSHDHYQMLGVGSIIT